MPEELTFNVDDLLFFVAAVHTLGCGRRTVERTAAEVTLDRAVANGVSDLAQVLKVPFHQKALPIGSLSTISAQMNRALLLEAVLIRTAQEIWGVDSKSALDLLAQLYDAEDGFTWGDFQRVAEYGLDIASLFITVFTIVSPIPGDEALAGWLTAERLKDLATVIGALNAGKYVNQFMQSDRGIIDAGTLILDLWFTRFQSLGGGRFLPGTLRNFHGDGIKDSLLSWLMTSGLTETNARRAVLVLQDAVLAGVNETAGTHVTSVHGKVTKIVEALASLGVKDVPADFISNSLNDTHSTISNLSDEALLASRGSFVPPGAAMPPPPPAATDQEAFVNWIRRNNPEPWGEWLDSGRITHPSDIRVVTGVLLGNPHLPDWIKARLSVLDDAAMRDASLRDMGSNLQARYRWGDQTLTFDQMAAELNRVLGV